MPPEVKEDTLGDMAVHGVSTASPQVLAGQQLVEEVAMRSTETGSISTQINEPLPCPVAGLSHRSPTMSLPDNAPDEVSLSPTLSVHEDTTVDVG